MIPGTSVSGTLTMTSIVTSSLDIFSLERPPLISSSTTLVNITTGAGWEVVGLVTAGCVVRRFAT